jgi:hypothetical protein
MGVPCQIFEHWFKSAEGGLGVDDPFDLAAAVAQSFEGLWLGQWCEFPVEVELAWGRPPAVDQECVAEPRAEKLQPGGRMNSR